MSRVCQVTNRKPSHGHHYAIRGIAKKKKGIGLKVTGKTKRRFLPNLTYKKIWFSDENRFISLRISAAGLRTLDRIGVAAAVRKMRAEGKKI